MAKMSQKQVAAYDQLRRLFDQEATKTQQTIFKGLMELNMVKESTKFMIAVLKQLTEKKP